MSRRRWLRRALASVAPAGIVLDADQRERDGRSRLTPREREVLDLVAEGMTNAQIGAALWISGGTVRRHLENVYGKLGVHTRTAAVRAAYR
jgi:DNA-binding CsgD family transcriptional regulator